MSFSGSILLVTNHVCYSYRTIAEDTENSTSPSSGFTASPQSTSDHSSVETSLTDGSIYASPAASSLSLSSSMDTFKTLKATLPTRLFHLPIRFNTAPPSRPLTPALDPEATPRSQSLFSRDDINSEEASMPRPFLLRKQKSFAPSLWVSYQNAEWSVLLTITAYFLPLLELLMDQPPRTWITRLYRQALIPCPLYLLPRSWQEVTLSIRWQ